jgi:hypothetical protein
MQGALGVLEEAHLRFPVGSARHHWAIHATHILHEWFLRRCYYAFLLVFFFGRGSPLSALIRLQV